MNAQVEHSRSRKINAQERVRREIAAHLHGPVQGRLLALRARLDALAGGNGMSPEASSSLKSVVDEMGRLIQRDIAALSRRLYPAIVRRGVIPCLQSLLDHFEPALRVRLKFDNELAELERTNPGVLPERTRLMAYRIAEEALTNVLKHAQTSQVIVEVGRDPSGWLTLAVRDDGPGFGPNGQIKSGNRGRSESQIKPAQNSSFG